MSVHRHDYAEIAEGLVPLIYDWFPDGKTIRVAVLVLHGFPEHALLFDVLAGKLAE